MLVFVDNIMLHTNSVDSNTLFFQEFRYKTRIYIWAKLSKHLKTSLGRAFKMLLLIHFHQRNYQPFNWPKATSWSTWKKKAPDKKLHYPIDNEQAYAFFTFILIFILWVFSTEIKLSSDSCNSRKKKKKKKPGNQNKT